MPVFPDWYCCLAVALEENLYVRYERYVLAGGDPKEYPKHLKPKPDAPPPQRNPLEMIMGAMKVPGVQKDVMGRRGSLDELAEVRGWPRVYKTEDGRLVDEHGNEVEPMPGAVFVPRKK